MARLVVLGIGLLVVCSAGCKKSAKGGPAALGSSTAAVTAGARPMCPYPKRCEQTCKDAHWSIPQTCASEREAVSQVMGTNGIELGKCNSACVTHKDECTGPATEAECKCLAACEAKLPLDVKAKMDVFHRCTATATMPCN
jgi:hypothetical protein